MRSLRVRLVVLTLFVAAVALAAVALFARMAVRNEFQRFERHERAGRLTGSAALLAETVTGATPRAEVDARLATLAGPAGSRFVLLGPGSTAIGASDPWLRAARFELGADGRMTIDSSEEGAGRVTSRRLVLVGAPSVVVRGRDGVVVGTLFALPPPVDDDEAPPTRQPSFVATVNRWLLLAALGSGVLAVGLSLALSRRILGPIEAVTAAARRMEQGDLGARVSVRSNDEVGALASAFNAMSDAVERGEKLRRSLVGDVAHELRTPLTNLRCQIEALQDGLQQPDEKTLRSLHEEALLLARLVDDLQELALAEAGQLSLERAPVRVAEAVFSALAAVGPVADAQGIALRAETPDGLVVDADRERLAQILRNLLANAVTHTPDGGTITVTARQEGGDVRIEVADTGTGIAAEHLPHVFERFYRGDPSRARATGGAGLGLAIVAQLVRAHGGRVNADSAPGQGTRVGVCLPTPR